MATERDLEGEIDQAVKKIGTLPPAERPIYGKQVNELKKKLTAEYESALAAEKERALERSLASAPPGRDAAGEASAAGPTPRLHANAKIIVWPTSSR